jgi:hypothetical protein
MDSLSLVETGSSTGPKIVQTDSGVQVQMMFAFSRILETLRRHDVKTDGVDLARRHDIYLLRVRSPLQGIECATTHTQPSFRRTCANSRRKMVLSFVKAKSWLPSEVVKDNAE